MKTFKILLMLAMLAFTNFLMLEYSEMVINHDAPVDSVFIPLLIYFFGVAVSIAFPVFLSDYISRIFGRVRI